MEPLPFEKITLPNGLDVILQEDHALPVVAVNVWYHVGSKDEEPGKTGFAHLFEHVMFEGSVHHNASHFEPLQKVGATLNGSTSNDRTNYWENLPSHYLQLALWLESDRMGFLLEALDQKRFDIQRDVVKNERRQSYENRPYGIASLRLQEALFPLPHPYHWPVIGRHEDLDAATLDDARSFFRRFYSPSNASLAIVGDFVSSEARALVERYFADLNPGTPVPRRKPQPSTLSELTGLGLYDRVSLPRLYLAWPTVPHFHQDEAALRALSIILGDGKSSRLYRTLVLDKRTAQSVNVHHGAEEIAGSFEIEVTVSPGHTIEEAEEATFAELARLREQAPTEAEVARVRNRTEWVHVRSMASIGGFGGRANRLNFFNIFRRDPGLINRDIQRFLAVRPEDIQRVATAYLNDTRVRLVVLPQPARAETAPIDRSVEPAPRSPRPFALPSPQRARLSNGLDLLVLEKRTLPAVAFGMLLNTGARDDPFTRPGLASFTTAMLEEGTESRSNRQIAEELEFIGSDLQTATGREHTWLATQTTRASWPKALDLVADLVRRPVFPDPELERLRRERLTGVRRLRDDPTAMAMRLAPALLFGRQSPYGHPVSGNEAVIEGLTRGDLVSHWGGHFQPNQATLIVVGDVSLQEVLDHAERAFGDWSFTFSEGRGAEEGSNTAPMTVARNGTELFLLDHPGAAQSVIRAGHAGVPRAHPDYFSLLVVNHLFGGQFTARLNMNLRQSKGYSYGYRSAIEWHRRVSSFFAGGSVQTAVTGEAVRETLKEFQELGGGRPPNEAELADAKSSMVRQLPSSFETPWEVRDHLLQLALFDLPDDYYQTASGRIEAVTLEEAQRVARERIEGQRLMVLVVGDRQRVEPQLRELGLPLRFIDHEGRET